MNTEDRLASIGFYTLGDNRARNSNIDSPLWRCELLITAQCNFNCPYCRKRTGTDIYPTLALDIIKNWCAMGLRNIRFSGGEPTMNVHLRTFVKYAQQLGIGRIAVSTNGSAINNMHGEPIYEQLLRAGVNDFSVSLDACCASTGDTMSGTKGVWDTVIKNIRFLAARTYTTVGIVLTEQNAKEALATIKLAHDLGVADIRIIPAAQNGTSLPDLNVSNDILAKHPILKYRIQNMQQGRAIRGISEIDNHRCPLVLDDMAMDEHGRHYPCIIYLRERGLPIGHFCGDMKKVRRQRLTWYEGHDCYQDPICKNNCLDVCVAYNNRYNELKENEK